MLKKIWSNLIYQTSRTIKKFKKALSLYYKSPLTLLTAFVLTVLLQLMAITGFWLVGQNLGITASIKYYYAFFTLTWVLGAIPVSIGGAVVVEGTLMFLFITLAGVPEDEAFALAITQRFIWLIASLPGAAVHLSGAHLPKEFFVDYDKPIN